MLTRDQSKAAMATFLDVVGFEGNADDVTEVRATPQGVVVTSGTRDEDGNFFINDGEFVVETREITVTESV